MTAGVYRLEAGGQPPRSVPGPGWRFGAAARAWVLRCLGAQGERAMSPRGARRWRSRSSEEIEVAEHVSCVGGDDADVANSEVVDGASGRAWLLQSVVVVLESEKMVERGRGGGGGGGGGGGLSSSTGCDWVVSAVIVGCCEISLLTAMVAGCWCMAAVATVWAGWAGGCCVCVGGGGMAVWLGSLHLSGFGTKIGSSPTIPGLPLARSPSWRLPWVAARP